MSRRDGSPKLWPKFCSFVRSFVAGSLSSKVFVLQYKSTIGIQTVNSVIGRLGVGRDSCSQKWKFHFHA